MDNRMPETIKINVDGRIEAKAEAGVKSMKERDRKQKLKRGLGRAGKRKGEKEQSDDVKTE